MKQLLKNIKELIKKPKWLLLAGVMLGIIVTVAIRFAFYNDHAVHYHANFAMYTNGQRDTFDGAGYYQEIASCAADSANDPAERGHMHDSKNDIIHVHEAGVTWGQFLQNLGYSASDRHLQTGSKVYAADDKNSVNFILNGQEVDNPTSTVIKSEDKLLISYGSEDKSALMRQYDAISSTAHQYNVGKDPGACMGMHKVSPLQRLKKTVLN